MKKISEKGITLIALVVTIIVLLILAGISIVMLTGQNGILNRAGEAREKTGVAQIYENVKLSVADALTKGTGSITRDNLEAALNKYVGEGKYDLSDTTNGWLISAGGKDYNVSSSGGISEEDGDDSTYNPNYSEKVKDEDIAPIDLFLYEVIDAEAKTASITGMNPKYCKGSFNYTGSIMKNKYASTSTVLNDSKYNHELKIAETSTSDEDNSNGTNYNIIYNDTQISDTLVVPYKWVNDADNEEYTIISVSLYAER